MGKSRDLADSANIINYLDNLTSAIEDLDGAGITSNAITVSSNTTLDANSLNKASTLTLNNGVAVTIPTDSRIELTAYSKIRRFP